jgi:hypothetical protein
VMLSFGSTGSRSVIHPGLGLLARMREMREAAVGNPEASST